MFKFDSIPFLLLSCLILPLVSCEKEPLPSIGSLVDEVAEIEEAPKFIPQKLFQLSSFKIDPFSKNSQGMDIFDDRFMFQAGIEQNTIHIIDLQESKALGTIWFSAPSGEYCHMNNINCGRKRLSTDTFPLLYLSQTSNSRACFVIHINNSGKAYQVVQTIKYLGNGHYPKNSSFDWFIDTENNYIYTYGKYNGNSTKREIMKFPLPTLDHSEHDFYDSDIIDSFVLDNQSIYQGSKIIDSLLYAPVGYGNSQYPGRLTIIDLNNKVVVEDVPMDCNEPESIGRYKNGAIICGGGKDPTYYFIRI